MTAKHGKKIKCGVHGVKLVRRGLDDQHVCIQLMGEDDGHWFNIGNSFSAFWLASFINALQCAEQVLKTECKKDENGLGYSFKKGTRKHPISCGNCQCTVDL